MAVKEFLDAVDKKKKKEEAAVAADAPVSAEVAPVAAAQIPNIPLEQALIQTSKDIVEYGKSGDAAPTILGTPAPAAPSMFGTPAPMESVVDTVGQAPAVQSPFGQTAAAAAAAAPIPVAAAVDPTAQIDVLAPAPTVQAPPVQAETPSPQPTGIVRRVARDVGSAVDSVAADLIGQSTGGRINLQSSPEFGQASTSTAGAPITDASQLSEFMSGLNEQAQIQAPPQVAAPATPDSVANLSVNGTDVVTPEAITGAGAEEALDPWRHGRGMAQRTDTGRAIIDGVEATPEQVALFNSTQAERTKAGDIAARKRYEARLENERLNPTPAPSAPAPSAPRRQSIRERDSIEKSRAEKLRKEGKENIDAQMREFNREPRSTKARAAEKTRLQRELNASIKEDRDYNRATEEARFAESTAQYNRGTLTAAQRAADDGGVSIRDQIALREEARGVRETQLDEIQSYNNASAAARSLVRDVSNIEDVAGTAKAQADSALTTGPGGLVMSILPGSKASDLRASLDTLTADSAFSALSEMRASSKTGGALGAISERELTLLGAAKRSLSANQSDEQLIKNINTYVEIRNRMMADAKLRFAQDYGVERANEAFGQSQGGASSIKNDRNVSGDAATEAFISKYNV